MATLRTPFDHEVLFEKVSKRARLSLGAALLCVGILLSGAALVSWWNSVDFNTARSNRAMLNTTLSAAHSPAELKAKASSLLELRKENYVTVLDETGYGKLTSAKVIQAVETVAKTGQPIHLDVHPYPTWGFLAVLPWAAKGAILIFTIGLFAAYGDICDSTSAARRKFLLDLEWRRGWPIALVAVTALPIGWVFYLVSAVRLHQRRQQLPTQWPEALERSDAPALLSDQPEQRYRFINAPQAARALYNELRGTAWQNQHALRLRVLRNTEKQLSETLRELGIEIRDTQSRRNEVRTELLQLDDITPESVSPDKLRGEFDCLMAFPGVAGVRVVDNEISLLVKAQLTYEGDTYDLGDWELRFNTQTFSSRELRSGVRYGGRYNAPVYRASSEFCFGDERRAQIVGNLHKGQLLQAIELAVNTLQSVNPRDCHLIPDSFEKVEANA